MYPTATLDIPNKGFFFYILNTVYSCVATGLNLVSNLNTRQCNQLLLISDTRLESSRSFWTVP